MHYAVQDSITYNDEKKKNNNLKIAYSRKMSFKSLIGGLKAMMKFVLKCVLSSESVLSFSRVKHASNP